MKYQNPGKFRVVWIRSTGALRFMGLEPVEHGSDEGIGNPMRFIGQNGETALVRLVDTVLGSGGGPEVVYQIEGDPVEPAWVGPNARLESAL
ncbi:MAG: hypothetical protein K8T20_04640 [Planctomycetes bacterium]|nr:hypothetical protein [Planctomycetota bacterium]